MENKILIFILYSILLKISYQQKECPSMTIKEYKELDQLIDCTAILGDLVLDFPSVFLDNESIGYTKEMINNRSFPLLTEITGYFGVMNVTHLDSLGKMFPELRVIRGRHLLNSFGFFIFDSSIREISLKNLIKIQYGSVAIKYSTMTTRLCPPVNIDWSEICENGQIEVFSHLLSGKDCEFLHPNSASCKSCENGHCWNNQFCQRKESFYKFGKLDLNCSEYCLGGCKHDTKKCYACQDISEDGSCVKECSKDKFLNVDTRRCISEKDCKGFILKHENRNECIPSYGSKPPKCPKNYQAIIEERKCKFCGENCGLKICQWNDDPINSISSLQELETGCTIINGSLLIEHMPHAKNLHEHLNEYLGNVQTINGALSISGIPSIMNLTFLNNLKFVKGDKSISEYAIQITKNHNLTSLFDIPAREKISGSNLKVESGLVMIYNNKNLCPMEVKTFMDQIEGADEPFVKIEDWKNKDSTRCPGIINIGTSSMVYSNNTVEISWDNMDSKVNVIYYQIKYVAYSDQNEIVEEIFDEDSLCCSSLQIRSIILDESEIEKDGNIMKYNLTDLEHYTRYAYLVQTNMQKDKSGNYFGAISHIRSFTTKFTSPVRVQSIKTVSKTQTSIEIEWEVSNFGLLPDGEIFYVDIYEVPYNKSEIDNRDYCENPMTNEEYDELTSFMNNEEYETCSGEKCCQTCCKDKKIRKEQNLNFDNKLSEYVKNRMRNKITKLQDVYNKTNHSRYYPHTNRSHTIEDLKPFTMYSFRIHACLPLNAEDIDCSYYTSYWDITLPNRSELYDKVIPTGPKVITDREGYQLNFIKPKNSNGIILNYNIVFYEFLENNKVIHSSGCITRKDYEDGNFVEIFVPNGVGHYAYEVITVSLGNTGKKSGLYHFEVIRSYFSIIVGIIVIIFIKIIIGVLYYYRHKLRNIKIFKRDDQVELIRNLDFDESCLTNNGSGAISFKNRLVS